jgi:hypothetical protein
LHQGCRQLGAVRKPEKRKSAMQTKITEIVLIFLERPQ